MADYIASVDAGNGGTNAVLIKNGANSYRNHYLPSVRAAATGGSLGLGSGLELEYQYYDWGGHRFVVGDDVVRITRRNLERHMGIDRYGNEFHQFLVAVALTQLGVSKGTVDLTLFAPPGLYLQVKPFMQERFMEQGGKVNIKLKDDKKSREWHYSSVSIWPEGIGAAACFILNEKGDVAEGSLLEGETVILDLGAYTLDALKMTDGNFNPESLEHATWENAGVHTHVREPILRAVHKNNEDFSVATVDDVDTVIRRGLSTDNFVLKIAGYEMDLKPAVEKFSQRYAEWMANNICDGVFNGFRGIKSVILVGGGSILVEKHLREWYGDKILDPKKYSATQKIHPVDFNAVGGLRLAMRRLKEGG